MSVEKPFSFYADLLSAVLRDYAIFPPMSVQSSSLERDIATADRRIRTEGLAFLHTHLPEFSDALLEMLENGTLPPIPSFKKAPGAKYPLFMADHWSSVCSADGSLLPEPSVQSIRALYQVGRLFKKLELPYPKEVEDAFIEKFKKVDAELRVSRSPKSMAILSRASNILSMIVRGLDLSDIRPKHGPGAVSTGEKQEGKWNFTNLFLDLDEWYNFYDYFIRSDRMFLDEMDDYLRLKVHTFATSKFVLVPKTAKTPRGIVTQPNELMFIQEGQMMAFVDHLERNSITAGQINFTHQTINQKLALDSSLDRRLATLDLTDASDRLSLELVKWLFRNETELLNYMLASRATYVDLPTGEVVLLRKFAAMGSALCFPVEALCFYVVCVASILEDYPHYTWKEVAPWVWVYGDDIIVPTNFTSSVIQGLELVGLKVNYSKSYEKGFFRESCGIHAYKGIDISPIHVKKILPSKKSDGASVESWISYAHAFETRGMPRSAEIIYSAIEGLLGYKLPYGSSDSGWICRLCDDPTLARVLNRKFKQRLRWNSTYQRVETHVPYLTVGYRDVRYKRDWHRLQKGVMSPNRHGDPSRVVVPRSTKIKRGWRG